MKLKRIIALSLSAAGLALALTACGSSSSASDDAAQASGSSDAQTTVKLGVVGAIYEDIWAPAKEKLADEGIDLEFVQFSDYVTPNNALANGEIDLNAFQHRIYLQSEIDSYGYEIENIGNTFIIPLNLYSDKVKSVDELKDGDTVAIPDDATNGGRALKVLEAAGLIKLKDGATLLSGIGDIVSNPKKLKFVELEPALLPRALDDVTAAVINANYALEAGFNPAKNAIALEEKSSPFGNVVAIREGDDKKEAFQKLKKAITSPEVKKFIEEKYQGGVLPVF